VANVSSLVSSTFVSQPARKQGDVVLFSVIEFWVENRILFEFLPPEFVPQYLQTMQLEVIEQMMGQPIEPVAV
jgi:hypothetical protein